MVCNRGDILISKRISDVASHLGLVCIVEDIIPVGGENRYVLKFPGYTSTFELSEDKLQSTWTKNDYKTKCSV